MCMLLILRNMCLDKDCTFPMARSNDAPSDHHPDPDSRRFSVSPFNIYIYIYIYVFRV